MDERLLKPYDPPTSEAAAQGLWLQSGAFAANPSSPLPPFSMVLPPPNVTGILHLGHAAMVTIEDIIARYARASGRDVLWVPGTDHAALATQAKVESLLHKETGQTRHDLGRDKFLAQVETYAQSSHDTIVEQIKRLGASLDWPREAYTLDATRERAVRTAFKQLYDDGLIYRGHRLVNWDPRLQTTVSDDEVEWVEREENFYYLKYGPFVIGTARPETKFGDKYVVMHPDDARYQQYEHGQKLTVEWISGPITATIIKDPSIDMAFGTGAMTITPAHDQADFDIATRHQLDHEPVIDLDGKLLPLAGPFAGAHIKKARPQIVATLEAKGLVEKVDPRYHHRIPTNSRGGEVLEPQVLKQWFLAVNKPLARRGGQTLKELMRQPVESGQIKITPDRFSKIYFHWIDNLRDWCISRQIWYGHRLPVWYRGDEIYCGIEAPIDPGWEQDPDTLDTWFSSGLWSFSTLGWPSDTQELKRYHPLTVMETGYDILFFWVARMILMSQALRGEIPFRQVYLHGIVRDEGGKKMSKSLGNIIDPLDMINKYGADALRLALIIGTAAGSDSKISEEKINGYKRFINKVWNASRFVIEHANNNQTTPLTAADQNTLNEFEALTRDVTGDLEQYRFYLAAEKLYHYFWHVFADKIIESVKERLHGQTSSTDQDSGRQLLAITLGRLLIMLQPFAPHITHTIWQIWKPDQPLIMFEPWPMS
ncbi:MAG: valine--tRNA ligase [Patescibacteria group bacterium]